MLHVSKFGHAATKFVDIEQVMILVPERFKLSNLNNVFLSWFSAVNENGGIQKLNSFLASNADIKSVYYEHDHHHYRGGVYFESFFSGETNLCIQLSNCDFLYPPVDQLAVFEADVLLHHRKYVALDAVHAKDFHDLVLFAQSYLKATVKFQLFYNFEDNRMQFKAVDVDDSKRGVRITFEPIDDCDHEFDDYWLDVSDGEEKDEREATA